MQGPRVARASDHGNPFVYLCKPRAQGLSKLLPTGRKSKRAPRSLQKCDIQMCLKGSQLLAYRRVGHPKRITRSDDAATVSERAKRPQGRERWKRTPIHMSP
jgi:hypothetical protein